MANDYMDSWELNGDTVLIQDFGKGKSNGVAVLDENGKIPMANVPVIYANNLMTSKNDKYGMTLKEWTEHTVSFIRDEYGKTYTEYLEDCVVLDYCAEAELVLLYNYTTSKCYIKSKTSELIELNFGTEYTYFTYFIKENNVIGIGSLYDDINIGAQWCYLETLALQIWNTTFLNDVPYSITTKGISVCDNVIYVSAHYSYNSVRYESILTSTDGINFTEVYKHLATYTESAYDHTGKTSIAHYNNIHVFNNKKFRITLNNGAFYYTDLETFTYSDTYLKVYVIKGVFTTGVHWSEDGIQWYETSHEELPTSSYTYFNSIGCVLSNKIVWMYDPHYDSYGIYTTDGKTILTYEREEIAIDGSIMHLYSSGIPPIRENCIVDNGVIFANFMSDNYLIKALCKSLDGIHFEPIKVVKVESGSGLSCSLSEPIADKGVLFVTEVLTDSVEHTTARMLYKTPNPNLWLPYSTFKNYIASQGEQ